MNSVTPLVLSTMLYTWMSYNYQAGSRLGMCITFVGYVIANIGLIIDSITGGH